MTITVLNYKCVSLYCKCILIFCKCILLSYRCVLQYDNCMLHFDIRDRMRLNVLFSILYAFIICPSPCWIDYEIKSYPKLTLLGIETWSSTRRTQQAFTEMKLVKCVLLICNMSFICNREPEYSVLSVNLLFSHSVNILSGAKKIT